MNFKIDRLEGRDIDVAQREYYHFFERMYEPTIWSNITKNNVLNTERVNLFRLVDRNLDTTLTALEEVKEDKMALYGIYDEQGHLVAFFRMKIIEHDEIIDAVIGEIVYMFNSESNNEYDKIAYESFISLIEEYIDVNFQEVDLISYEAADFDATLNYTLYNMGYSYEENDNKMPYFTHMYSKPRIAYKGRSRVLEKEQDTI